MSSVRAVQINKLKRMIFRLLVPLTCGKLSTKINVNKPNVAVYEPKQKENNLQMKIVLKYWILQVNSKLLKNILKILVARKFLLVKRLSTFVNLSFQRKGSAFNQQKRKLQPQRLLILASVISPLGGKANIV